MLIQDIFINSKNRNRVASDQVQLDRYTIIVLE